MNPVSNAAVEEALSLGRLEQAVQLVKEQVKRLPGNVELRCRLFQLFCLQGDWDRAQTQLQLLGDLERSEGEMLLAVPMLTSLISAEKQRDEVFGGRTTPVVFGEPPEWMGIQFEALRCLGQGHVELAATLFRQALEVAPASSGSIDGQAFSWISDADARQGPAMEAIIRGTYYWMPFSCLKRLELDQPENLHERIWRSGNLTLSNGSTVQAYLPVRYPGTVASGDEALMMVREAAWETLEGGLSLGRGQRFWATDQEDHPLLKVSRIEFGPLADEPTLP